MARVAVAETHPDFDWSEEGLSISRKVVSEDLDVIFGRLALLSAGAEGIVLPINPLREVSPVTNLVKTKEIQAHNSLLRINKHNIDMIRAELVEELPALNIPRTALIKNFDIHRESKTGTHYLAFIFSEDSGFELSEERADVWDVLQDMRVKGRKTLDRRAYCPDIRVARISPNVSAVAVGHIGSFIVKKLKKRPLEVTLASVLESSPSLALQSQHIAA